MYTVWILGEISRNTHICKYIFKYIYCILLTTYSNCVSWCKPMAIISHKASSTLNSFSHSLIENNYSLRRKLSRMLPFIPSLEFLRFSQYHCDWYIIGRDSLTTPNSQFLLFDCSTMMTHVHQFISNRIKLCYIYSIYTNNILKNLRNTDLPESPNYKRHLVWHNMVDILFDVRHLCCSMTSHKQWWCTVMAKH